MMKPSVIGIALVGVFVTALAKTTTITASDGGEDQSRVKQGFAISPVKLNLKGKNRAWVGMGSYLVNAVGSCNDCHSCPSYTPGHNPYDGVGDGQINGANYLAGGVPFGPGLVSANLTPDVSTGLPENHTFDEFLSLMRTGHDPEDPPGDVLQVMPWPVLRNMTRHDIRAIYEYLRAVPPATPGSCGFPGQ